MSPVCAHGDHKGAELLLQITHQSLLIEGLCSSRKACYNTQNQMPRLRKVFKNIKHFDIFSSSKYFTTWHKKIKKTITPSVVEQEPAFLQF
jgi:hypothetical protein